MRAAGRRKMVSPWLPPEEIFCRPLQGLIFYLVCLFLGLTPQAMYLSPPPGARLYLIPLPRGLRASGIRRQQYSKAAERRQKSAAHAPGYEYVAPPGLNSGRLRLYRWNLCGNGLSFIPLDQPIQVARPPLASRH